MRSSFANGRIVQHGFEFRKPHRNYIFFLIKFCCVPMPSARSIMNYILFILEAASLRAKEHRVRACSAVRLQCTHQESGYGADGCTGEINSFRCRCASRRPAAARAVKLARTHKKKRKEMPGFYLENCPGAAINPSNGRTAQSPL